MSQTVPNLGPNSIAHQSINWIMQQKSNPIPALARLQISSYPLPIDGHAEKANIFAQPDVCQTLEMNLRKGPLSTRFILRIASKLKVLN